MSQESRLLIESNKDVTTIHFLDSSILDETNIRAMADEWMKVAESHVKPKILVDFSNVKYLSSAVLGKLIALHKRVRENKGKLVLCAIDKPIMEVFKITKLQKVFTIEDDAAKAMKVFE